MTLRFEWRLLITLLRRAWPVWAGIGGVVLPILAGTALTPNAGRVILYAGTTLQVVGILLVVRGLTRTRRLFGRPSLVEQVVSWFQALRLVVVKPDPIVAYGSAAISPWVVGAARVRTTLPADAPLDERVAKVEADIADLHDRLDESCDALRNDLQTLREYADAQLERQRGQVTTANTKLEEFAVGGLRAEWLGLWWLFAGTIFTNIPAELAALWALLN